MNGNGIDNIDVEALVSMLENDSDGVMLVDVRGAGETAQGIIRGARLLPLHLVPMNVDRFRGPERKVLYCHSGARSAQACHFLARQGVAGLGNLEGGIMAWVMEGQRLVPPDPGASLV
ncbi:MAG: rhodanese-like domain-containing protein [Halothiobacillaceae bacterium]